MYEYCTRIVLLDIKGGACETSRNPVLQPKVAHEEDVAAVAVAAAPRPTDDVCVCVCRVDLLMVTSTTHAPCPHSAGLAGGASSPGSPRLASPWIDPARPAGRPPTRPRRTDAADDDDR